MAKAKNAVLLGFGTLYIDEVSGGAAFPANPTVTPAAGWEDIGYTDEGVAIQAEQTFEDVEVEEEYDPLDTVRTLQRFKVVAALAQNSLTNLQIALGGGTITAGSPTGYDTFTFPASTDTPKLYQLLFRAKAPGTAFLRDWQFPNVRSVGGFEISHRKAPQKQLITVEFQVVKPDSGAIVTVIDDVT